LGVILVILPDRHPLCRTDM